MTDFEVRSLGIGFGFVLPGILCEANPRFPVFLLVRLHPRDELPNYREFLILLLSGESRIPVPFVGCP